MRRERRFDEPWNLPPVPSWCGNPVMQWGRLTAEQRKIEWMRYPQGWQEKTGRERVAYWRSRRS